LQVENHLRVGPYIWERVETVLQSGVRLALASTGGGGELISWLLNHPGASRAIVEAQVPYSQQALEDYLGYAGPHRVKEQTARDMAGRAFQRAALFTGEDNDIIGVGCTAALATSRQRRGADRVCVALRLAREYRFYTLHFEAGAADRLEQEEVLSRLTLEAIVAACGGEAAGATLPGYARLSLRSLALDDPLGLLLDGELDLIEVNADGEISAEVERRNRLLCPGSFNPLHEGHQRLALVAGQLSGRQPSLELSIANVDKPALTRTEVETRLADIRGRLPVILTRVPTFLQKARFFGGCHFAIGYDTAVRILQAKYYEGGEEGLAAALGELTAEKCCFWVAGRLEQGHYRTLDDLDIPKRDAALFAGISEEAFRLDISSTELRLRTEEKPR